MTDFGPHDVLFMGAGNYVTAWYRCILPAIALQCDWIGYGSFPPKIRSVTGFVRGDLQEPDYDDYKVIVVQQPRGKGWAKWIRLRQAKGIKVLYEIDDDVHAVSKMKTHQNRYKVRSSLKDIELCLRLCDGIIASTPYLHGRMQRFNEHVYLCEVGIDMERYQLERGESRDSERMIGFAGGIGHEVSLLSWLPGIADNLNESTSFTSVGVRYGDLIDSDKAQCLPFTAAETWPAALANFDVVLAPGGNNNFFRAKSELRWIEAAAMGLPVVASPVPYGSIIHMKTGLLVHEPDHVSSAIATLLRNPDVAAEMGQEAREAVIERHHIRNRVEQWIHAFELAT